MEQKNTDNIAENIHGALGAITDTAPEVLGKARKKKKPQMTDDILHLCDRTRSVNKRRKDSPVARLTSLTPTSAEKLISTINRQMQSSLKHHSTARVNPPLADT